MNSIVRTAIGVDFGSESARAVLVDVATGRELASAVSAFPHGVIEDRPARQRHSPPPGLGAPGPR